MFCFFLVSHFYLNKKVQRALSKKSKTQQKKKITKTENPSTWWDLWYKKLQTTRPSSKVLKMHNTDRESV